MMGEASKRKGLDLGASHRARAAVRKGKRLERELVNLFLANGIEAYKVPGSGSLDGFPGDVVVGKNAKGTRHSFIDNATFRAEMKGRKGGAGFKTIEGWKGSNPLLILKRNNAPHFALMDWSLFISLLGFMKKENVKKGE